MIVAGNGFTVTTAVVIQPVDTNLYVIIAVPDAPVPSTTPVVDPTLAVPGALLLHVPTVVISLNVVDSPEHTDIVPVMFAGNELIVIIEVVMQPVGKV